LRRSAQASTSRARRIATQTRSGYVTTRPEGRRRDLSFHRRPVGEGPRVSRKCVQRGESAGAVHASVVDGPSHVDGARSESEAGIYCAGGAASACAAFREAGRVCSTTAARWGRTALVHACPRRGPES
jgi:hypothetical protein